MILNMKIKLIAFLILIVGLTLIYWHYKSESENAHFVTDVSQTVGHSHIGGDFTLTDQNGRVRTYRDFQGKFMLIYFGYTYCPDMCPMALETISSVLAKLGRDKSEVATVFVTVDPKRDTQDVLKAYAQNFDSSLVMCRGTEKQTKDIMKAYGVYAKHHKPKDATQYLIDHSTLIYLFDPKGNLVAHFNHEVNTETLFNTIQKQFLSYKKNQLAQRSFQSLKKVV